MAFETLFEIYKFSVGGTELEDCFHDDIRRNGAFNMTEICLNPFSVSMILDQRRPTSLRVITNVLEMSQM